MPGNPKKQHRNAITEWNATATTANCRQKALLDQRDFLEMEKGHRVCKLVVLKKFDIVYRRIWLNTQTQQIALSKWTSAMDSGCIPGPSSFLPNGLNTLAMGGRTASLSSVSSNGGPQSKTHTLDLLLVREVAILGKLLSCPGSTMQIAEKWRRDGALQRLDPSLVLCIAWGAGFLPVTWLILFDSKEACQLWAQGLGQICAELASAPHALVVERWLRKQFCALLPHSTDTGCLTIKQMKPFVQQRLQYKVTSKQLQEITDSELSFEGFVFAHNRLLDFHSLFTSMFAEFADPQCSQRVQFQQFFDFQRTFQKGDQLGQSREMASDFLRHYLRDVDPDRDLAEPGLSTAEFIDYLYSPENSLFDPLNKEIVHDMTKPLTHYWISSSHNTYLTGDQLKSESSLDAYSRALLMGCRCIELDCWDGAQRRGGPGGEIQVDIVIYHGYTMTSKLALRDVLYTIKQYAFQTSEYPVILSIEDNCSVPAQRQMAVDIQEVMGDLLLTAPVSRDEWQLPSPAALRRKIILKHKKLQNDRQEADAVSLLEDELEQDILSRRCTKKGVLWLKGGPSSGGTGSDWAKHIFVLFNDRFCFLVQPIDQYRGEGSGGNALNGNGQKPLAGRENSLSSQGDENLAAEEAANDAQIGGNADACAEAHITEEWFHGKVDREVAKTRLLEGAKTLKLNGNSSNGLFLVRESSTFIGDFTLSFLHNGAVHHCRIKASIPAGGERKYHLLDTVRKDTLYELISYYTRHSLDTPNFKTFLQTACPQPQPQRGQSWYSEQADTQKAEELLNAVNADGAFLIRHSTGDRAVFVLSLRVDGKSWHYRLKREGRIFVVNQHMFENLCQLVDYYSQNQFVRGVCLKYPVNEITVGKYAKCLPQFSTEFGNMDPRFDGYYMELKDLEKEIQAEATRAFNCDELAKSVPTNFRNKILTFPMGARITVLQKEAGNPGSEETSTPLWMGRYNNEVGWFPADCVREMPSSVVASPFDDCLVGPGSELNYGTIELVGTKFEKVDSDRANSFHISLAQSHWNVQEYLVAADCPEEMEEWLAACQHQAQQANDKMHQLRTREKQLGIASELSSLVVYCQAVPFNPDFELQDNRFNFYEMCSFSESKHDRLVERGLIRFNQRQLSRVYPQASRLTSANFNPMPMWNNGCHMVALNFQTGDKAMQLNAGRFMANGRCGFVLKPQYLMDETFRQKSPALESRISKCRACRRLKQQMAKSSSQVVLENLAGQRRQSACWEEGVKENKKETFGRIRPPKLSLTTNSSGDCADEELLKSTRRTSSFPPEEEEECGGNDDCCSCRNDETQNSNNNNNNCQNNQLSNSLPNPSSSTSLLAAPNAQFASNCPISLHILVISGRHLSRRGCYDKGGICSPYVEVELLGFAQDAQMQRTNTITSNGLNPIWQESFLFYVQHPEMCLLRFYVEDGDFVGPKTDPFIGQATFPLDCIRPGFRSIPLLNQFSEPLELSALLVHVEIRHWDPSASTTLNPPVHHNRSNSLVPAAAGSASSSSNTSSLLLGSGSTLGALLPSSSSTMAPSNPSTSSQSTLPQSIHNVHQLLQLGRSIYSGAQPFNNTTMVNENISRQLNRNTSTQQLAMPSYTNGAGALIGGLPSSYGQQMGSGSSRRTSRSTSMESGDTTTTNNSTVQMLPLTKRGMGSNTLRKIFRLDRNNNN